MILCKTIEKKQRLSNISHAVQKYVEANGFSIVHEYVKHGVGQDLHANPDVRYRL